MNWQSFLLEQLKRHEGLRLKPYKCSAGVWTIGYGHTKGVTKDSPAITRQEAEDLLMEDMQDAIGDARRLCPCFHNLAPARKVVVSNMAFNLGYVKLSKFKRTLAALCAGDYKSTALYMLDSLWARQVGNRAKELANLMSVGKLPDGS